MFNCPIGHDRIHCRACFFSPHGRCIFKKITSIKNQCCFAVYPMDCDKKDCRDCDIKAIAMAKINEGIEV